MRKTLMLGKIEGKRRRGLQNIVGWHHGLDGHEFEQALGIGQVHIHRVGDAIQPSHPLLSPYPPALNLSQH